MARARVKKIDNVFWGLGTATVTALGAGNIGATVIASGTQAATLLRVRGECLVFLDAVQAPGTLVRLTMGIIKVPEGTGTTILWEPFGDDNAPWIWYDVAHLGYEEQVVDVVDSPQLSARRIHIDNKAMRRIRPDEEVQFVVTNTSVATASAVNVFFTARMLLGF